LTASFRAKSKISLAKNKAKLELFKIIYYLSFISFSLKLPSKLKEQFIIEFNGPFISGLTVAKILSLFFICLSKLYSFLTKSVFSIKTKIIE
jgi:hypothetical protein